MAVEPLEISGSALDGASEWLFWGCSAAQSCIALQHPPTIPRRLGCVCLPIIHQHQAIKAALSRQSLLCISVDMLTRASLKRRLAAERCSQTNLPEANDSTVHPTLRSSDEQTENAQSSETVSGIIATCDATPPQDADPSVRIRQMGNEEPGSVSPATPTLFDRDNISPTVVDEPRENVAALPFSVTSGNVVSKIEAIMENIIDQLLEVQDMSINLVSRRPTAQGRTNRLQPVRFTARSNVEAIKFGQFCYVAVNFIDSVVDGDAARVLLILQLSHSALVSGIILTKRYARSGLLQVIQLPVLIIVKQKYLLPKPAVV